MIRDIQVLVAELPGSVLVCRLLRRVCEVAAAVLWGWWSLLGVHALVCMLINNTLQKPEGAAGKAQCSDPPQIALCHSLRLILASAASAACETDSWPYRRPRLKRHCGAAPGYIATHVVTLCSGSCLVHCFSTG